MRPWWGTHQICSHKETSHLSVQSECRTHVFSDQLNHLFPRYLNSQRHTRSHSQVSSAVLPCWTKHFGSRYSVIEWSRMTFRYASGIKSAKYTRVLSSFLSPWIMCSVQFKTGFGLREIFGSFVMRVCVYFWKLTQRNMICKCLEGTLNLFLVHRRFAVRNGQLTIRVNFASQGALSVWWRSKWLTEGTDWSCRQAFCTPSFCRARKSQDWTTLCAEVVVLGVRQFYGKDGAENNTQYQFLTSEVLFVCSIRLGLLFSSAYLTSVTFQILRRAI